jgi:hypothetical protein
LSIYCHEVNILRNEKYTSIVQVQLKFKLRLSSVLSVRMTPTSGTLHPQAYEAGSNDFLNADHRESNTDLRRFLMKYQRLSACNPRTFALKRPYDPVCYASGFFAYNKKGKVNVPLAFILYE